MCSATVKSGDTFSAFALTYGVEVKDIEQLNPGTTSNSLRVGQVGERKRERGPAVAKSCLRGSRVVGRAWGNILRFMPRHGALHAAWSPHAQKQSPLRSAGDKRPVQRGQRLPCSHYRER